MPYAKSALLSPAALGDGESCDSLAIRDRLSSAYKALAMACPRALDHHAALNASLHDGFAGRLRTLCRVNGLTDAQYAHFVEGLAGDGYSVALLMVLLEAAPATVAQALDDVLQPLGFEVRRRETAKPTTAIHEVGANVSERVGTLSATTFRALRDGKIDREEASDISKDIAALETVVAELKAHARNAR